VHSFIPKHLASNIRFKQISGGKVHSLALAENGALYSW
jgi:hypothetical protein